MARSIARTVIIGVGGVGQSVVAFAKRRMLDTYGEIPPAIEFLAMDADVGDASLRLDAADFVQISLKDPAGFLKAHPEVGEWLDDGNIPLQSFKEGIDRGAGQIRQMGRLAFMSQLPQVVQLVRHKLNKIMSWEVAAGEAAARWHVSSAPPSIIICGSIAGGTGSGVMLDLAAALRSMPEASDREIVGYFVLPGVFMGKDRTHFVEENSYAFLKELDFFTSEVTEVQKHPDLFSYSVGAVKYSMAAPFDRVMLIDNERQDCIRFDDPADLAEAVALAVLTTTGGPIGESIDAVLCNPPDTRAWDGGKRPLYSTFGVCEVHYPSGLFADYGSAVFADRLAQRLVIPEVDTDGGPDGIVADREAFLSEGQGLREKGNADNQIGDRILPPREFAPNIPKELKSTEVAGIWSDNDQRVLEFVQSSAKIAAEKRAALIEEVKTRIRAKLAESVRMRGGQYSIALASSLKGYFESVIDEKKKGEEAEAGVEARYASMRESAARALQGEAFDATKRWFSGERIRKLMGAYHVNLLEIVGARAAAIRSEEVAHFCSSMVVVLDDLLANLTVQQATAGSLLSRSSHARESLENQLTHPGPFECITVPPLDSIDLPDVATDDFWTWLAESRKLDVLGFWDKGAQEVYELLVEYAAARDITQSLRDGSLATVVNAMTDSQRDSLVREADAKATPLLHWDARIVDARPDLRKPDYQYIVGAPAGFLSMFDPAKTADGDGTAPQAGAAIRTRSLQDRLATGEVRSVRSIVLDDKDRAVFLKLYGDLPAYALAPFDSMRSEYLDLARTQGQWCLHLDKRWVGEIPDLGCEVPEEDLWVWALAVSDIPYFNCVTQTAATFRYVNGSEAGGSDTEPATPPLGIGRSAAMAAFVRDRDRVAEAKAAIIAAITRHGNAAASEDLSDWAERLNASCPVGSQDRKLIDRETAAIRDLIEKQLA